MCLFSFDVLKPQIKTMNINASTSQKLFWQENSSLINATTLKNILENIWEARYSVKMRYVYNVLKNLLG